MLFLVCENCAENNWFSSDLSTPGIGTVTVMLRRAFYASLYAYHLSMIYFGLSLLFEGPTGVVVIDEAKEHFWKLISIWAHVLQQLYFFVHLLSCSPHFNEKWRQQLQSSLNYWFLSLVFPITLFVCIVFWCLYSYNRTLIYPETIDLHIPELLNHAFHTAPIPIVFIHMFTTDHSNPPVLSACFCVTVTYVLYILVLLSTYIFQGKWLYLWFISMTTTEVMLSLVACYLIAVMSLFFGLGLNTMISNKKNNRLKDGCKNL